jgi:hypothetical protein
MKYYETALTEYVERVEQYNIHEDHALLTLLQNDTQVKNTIIYGPPGIGKYSQMLYLLSKVVGKFKFQQKMYVQKDAKEDYTYMMTDVFFEIDMGLLGCNSKTLWHDIYLQILDIVIIKPSRVGIIVCKNFHLIHSELLDIFYSYIQDNYKGKDVVIKYIIITEQISFISNNILNNFVVVNLARPSEERYRTLCLKNGRPMPALNSMIVSSITNIKDLYKGTKGNATMQIICNNIIEQIENSDKIVITQFRDLLYEILTYGLDICECIWYILYYFDKKRIPINDMEPIYEFLKKFNNNYRPITHLEYIFFNMIQQYRANNSH